MIRLHGGERNNPARPPPRPVYGASQRQGVPVRQALPALDAATRRSDVSVPKREVFMMGGKGLQSGLTNTSPS